MYRRNLPQRAVAFTPVAFTPCLSHARRILWPTGNTERFHQHATRTVNVRRFEKRHGTTEKAASRIRIFQLLIKLLIRLLLRIQRGPPLKLGVHCKYLWIVNILRTFAGSWRSEFRISRNVKTRASSENTLINLYSGNLRMVKNCNPICGSEYRVFSFLLWNAGLPEIPPWFSEIVGWRLI